ncbi:putative ribonuclease H-like domain-containing protein [Tanacetum coccineum]
MDESIAGKKEESRSISDSRWRMCLTGQLSEDDDNYAFMANNSTGADTQRIIVPLGGLACLIAKATTDESNLWHRRLGHVNFKNLNRLVKGNLVRGLPTKIFQNDHTCVACQKGKQHKASCKAKLVSSISHTLQLLHMDLFGPTSIRTKDETSAILKDFIRQIENQLNQKESRGNIAMPELHNKMELLRERTGPLLRQQEPCLQIHFYLTLFWGEQLVLLCYVLNSGKFAGKSDEGFLVGYSLQSKAFRVYNLVTKRVEENLHITFLENKPNVAGKGPNWLFDLDYLTDSMNYLSVSSENQANIHVRFNKKLTICSSILAFLFFHQHLFFQININRRKVIKREAAKTSGTNIISTVSTTAKASGTNFVNTVSIPVGTASANEGLSLSNTTNSQEDDYEISPLEVFMKMLLMVSFLHSSYDDEGAVADFTNLETIVNVSPIPTSREELLQFEIQKVWILVDLPYGKKAIGTKWVYRNKKDERGVVVRNKARLVARDRQEEGLDFDEIDEEVYVSNHQVISRDPESHQKVYKSGFKAFCMDYIQAPKSLVCYLYHFLGEEWIQKRDNSQTCLPEE